MKRLLRFLALSLSVAMAASAFAGSLPEGTAGAAQLNGRVHHALAMIPDFTIFDNVSYRVEGNTVTLNGQVRNPTVKDEALQAVKHLEGVERVDNQIEVLPASFNDDRIRLQVARAVLGDSTMTMYRIQPVPPIHIIVKNGHVDLEGVVRSEMDKNIAFMRANGVSGVFSVENNLPVEKSARS